MSIIKSSKPADGPGPFEDRAGIAHHGQSLRVELLDALAHALEAIRLIEVRPGVCRSRAESWMPRNGDSMWAK